MSVFTLPVVVGLVGLSLFTNPDAANIYFFKWQTDFFGAIQEIAGLNFMLACGWISIIANQLNIVFNKNSFYSKDSFLPGFIYVAGLVTFKAIDFSPLMVAHLFVVGAMSELLQMKRQQPSKDNIFNASFLLGLAIVFSPLMITLVILPWIAVMLIKPFAWREWVVAVIGLVLPVLMHYVVHYVATGSVIIERMDATFPDAQTTWTIPEGAVYVLSVIILLVAVFKFFLIIRGQIVSFKKMSQLIFIMAMLTGLSLVGGWYFFNQLYLAVLLPLSFIISIQLLNAGRVRLANSLVLAWFITGVVNLFAG